MCDKPLIRWLYLTFHSTSPLKMSLLAMSTLFQATASFSSSRKSWASWLWLLQADAHAQTHKHKHTYTHTRYKNLKMSELSTPKPVAGFLITYLDFGTLPLTRALRMTVSSSELSCSGSWTVRRCPWSSIFWIWQTGWQLIVNNILLD